MPSRLEAELGVSLSVAGRQPARDASGRSTPAAQVFQVGGEALGQGIASLLNIVNPSHLVLILPGDLAPEDHINESAAHPQATDAVGKAKPGTAAAEYLRAVEKTIDDFSFSRAARDARAGRDRLTIQVLEPDRIDEQGALGAATGVLDAFVMHARERDRCRELVADGSTPLADQG